MKYIITAAMIAVLTGCIPDGPSPRPDAGTDVVQQDRCGGCERGECVELEGYGRQCAESCEYQPCQYGTHCTKVWHGDEPEYKCTQEKLLDG